MQVRFRHKSQMIKQSDYARQYREDDLEHRRSQQQR